ncbi:alpha-2-macroglobulin family protein [Bacteroides caecimuris]|uniref:alpha-2-macroglobulin family protein n=2 Tax=Bacteroides caecimuris TaxID=1796613 RepID=UPI00242EF95F|nr:alpha-2-macroglobulin family protein [Bacteroides caecimuris]
MNTILCRMKGLLLLGLLFLSSEVFGQPMIGNDASPETLVFELTNKEALKLLKGKLRQKQWDKIQQAPFARFTDTWTDPPVKGHFLLADVERNEVHYRYAPVIPFHVFLFKEYGVLTLQVVDAEGVIRKDAKVRVGGKAVYYDQDSQTYTDDNWSQKEQHILTVELDKFRAIFDLTKHLVSPWYQNDYGRQNGPEFYSYLITDKNKYKPGETVRFKSYALSEHKRPLKQELSLWMRVGSSWRDYKRIMPVIPYHPGGFAGEFQLNDSLNFKLDQRYSIQLRDKRGRIVASTHFNYEDYELNGNKLLATLASNVQYAPQSNRVDISATDANGLPLREANVEVTIGREQVFKSYTEILSLPDTLMSVQAELDASGKVSVDIPSQMFGASDCFYHVNVVLLTADNNRLEQQDKATFYYSCYDVQCTTQADTICFSFFDLGVEHPLEAELTYGEKKEVKKVRLPYREPFNQTISDYRFKIPEIGYETIITPAGLDPKLELNGGIEKDSFCVSLSNPLQLELSWYVYQGNRLLQKGSGKEMEHKSGEIDPSSVYYVEVFYFMGNKECMMKRSYTSPSERLVIESDLPERIYPGQTVTTKLNVTNIQGYPVSNVDLTAFAVNSQLDYQIPDLPYYGSAPRPREQRASYSMKQKEYLHTATLDYKRWNELLHLEELPYYRFAYPSGNLYRQTVDTPDGTTQFAPYVMLDGKAVNIYVIEQNDIPCYFSWTEQPQGYSFPVLRPAGKQKITLRMHDRAFIIDSLAFERGKKTILSFDMNRLPQGVEMVWLRQKKGKYYEYQFTKEEKKRYERYLCRLPVMDGAICTTLEHDGKLFPVSFSELSRYKKNILAGPVEPGPWKYMNGVLYRHEGGFSYEFDGNVVYKYKDDELCPRYLHFSSVAKIATLNDYYLSPERFRNLVSELRKGKSWHPTRIYFSLPDKKLNFRLPEEKDSTGVASLFFKDCTTGELIYPDTLVRMNRIYSRLPAGTYDAILLYNNGKYLKQEALPIKSYSYLDVNMESLPLHEADSLSAGWLLLGGRGVIGTNHPSYKEMRITQYVRSYGGKVCGYVTDATGEALVGCSVLIKGTTEGTITNVDGYFEMDCDRRGEQLLFSYVGFKPQEMRAMPGSNLLVTLEENSQALDEVVVVGYGISRKYSLTGALAGVRVDQSFSATTPLEELDGQDKEEKAKEEADANRLYTELLQLNGLRRNFSDVAFWQPRLFTDKTGTVRFETTFPDNVTKWETVVYAMNRRLQTGTFRRSIRSYKPLMAELKTPRFLVEGDQSTLVGTIRNYLDGQRIEGTTQFCVGTDTLKQREVDLTEGFHETLPMQAANTDSVTISYLFTRKDGYKDGEEYTIPVLPQGTELAQGTLGILSDEETVSVQSGKDEEVVVSITDNQLDIYKESVNFLTGYRYLCNEQLASKLIGLLAYQQYMLGIGEKAKGDKAIRTIIRRLMNHQNKHRLWSWWGNSENTSFWMSAHILRALKMAKDAGYPVDLNLNGLKVEYAHIRPYRGMKLEDIEILHALHDWKVEADYSAAVRLLEPFVRQLEQKEDSLASRNKHYRPLSYLKEKLLLWEIKQQVDSVNVGDSVRHYLKKDMLGGVYCDDGRRTHYWEGNQMINTLIAYRVIKNDSSLCKLKENMQLYILRTKERGWNTYQASAAVATVLTDLLTESERNGAGTSVSVSGKENKRIMEFPYHARLTAGDSLFISKTGKEPLLYSVYSTKRVMDARESDAFKVEAVLEKDSLVAGVPVMLTVTLQVKQEGAQYVMLEVPIPAGCSYASKPVNFSRSEVYREYFKEKTVIFSEKLPVGTYQFTIPLLPRFTGKYTLNPVKVELMYFPVVNANNEGRKIWITERNTKE